MEDPATSIPPSSLWGSLNSWFTSTVFFILLNLMIATILFTSNLPNNNNQQQNHQEQEQEEGQKKHNPQNQPQIARSPSILHRLKSFNFLPQQSQIEDDNNHHEQEPLHLAATQYVFNQPLHYQHFDFDSDQTHQVEMVNNQFEFDPTRSFDPNRQEINKVNDASFDFEPTRKENGRDASFDFDPTRKENDRDASLNFEPIRKEKDRDANFDFDPTRKDIRGDNGFGFDPTREEIPGDTGFGFDPTHEDEQSDEFESLDEVYSKLKRVGHHDRTKSDSMFRQKPTTKFKKSASLKVGFSNLDEVKTRRPETVRERKTSEDDVEVDSKADDFINKFKNDLKLQRIESIMKSKSGKK